MRILWSAATAAAALVGVDASAAVLTYNVAGTFEDDSLLSGSFSFDDAGVGFSQFSNVAVSVSSPGSFVSNRISGAGFRPSADNIGPFRIGFSTANQQNSLQLTFLARNQSFSLREVIGSSFLVGTQYTFNEGAGTVRLRSGTITQAIAAVPEPASWAMMLIGFGLIASAVRYRRRSTATTYA